MLKILGGELFITVMAAVFLASLGEFFLGQGRISSDIIYIAVLFSTIGLFSGLIAKASSD